MNWKFWQKKVEPVVLSDQPKKYAWNVDIIFYSGTSISFNRVFDENEQLDFRSAFKDFYCWHNYGKTEEYEFIYDMGAYKINRKDIRLVHYNKKAVK